MATRTGVLLEETFYILSKKNSVYRVQLTDKGLVLQKEGGGGAVKTETVRAGDIVGCRCVRGKRRRRGGAGAGGTSSCACHRPGEADPDPDADPDADADESDVSAYLYIYAYVLKRPARRLKGLGLGLGLGQGDPGAGVRRERLTVTLRFRSFERFEDNLREGQRWRSAVRALALASASPAPTPTPATQIEGGGRLLVVLNPRSGPGRARELFRQRVAPALAEAELPYDLLVTRHRHHARAFLRRRRHLRWRAVVVLGGDGVVFEVLNGLLERPDWRSALSCLPLAVIPCGSGNGLAKSVAAAASEPYDANPVLVSALNVIKGRPAPMDLVRVETKAQILFSFLSIGWGFLSDIDIESERLRAIGGQRFTIWSVARLIGLRTYCGKLWYDPVAEVAAGGDAEKSGGGGGGGGGGVRRSPSAGAEEEDTQAHRPPLLRSSLSFHDCIDHDDVLESLDLETAHSQAAVEAPPDVSSVDGEEEDPGQRPRLDSYYSATSRRSTYFSASSAAGGSFRSLQHDDEGDEGGDGADDESEDEGDAVRMYGPASQLPALTQPVPPHWKSIQGEFVMVHASYQTHLGSDCLFAPNSKLADGIIWLLVIRAGITRTQLLQFLLGLSSGTHLSCPKAEMIPVTAFRLVPEDAGQGSTSTGHMTVDGELVDYGPIQAEVMPSLANILVR